MRALWRAPPGRPGVVLGTEDAASSHPEWNQAEHRAGHRRKAKSLFGGSSGVGILEMG